MKQTPPSEVFGIKQDFNARKVSRVFIFSEVIQNTPLIFFNVLSTSCIHESIKLTHYAWKVCELIPNLVSMSPKTDQVFTCHAHIKHIRYRICPQNYIVIKM